MRCCRTSASCIRPANKVFTPVNHVMGSASITFCRFVSGRGLGHENVPSAGDEEQHQVRGEREDVVQRQRRQHHLLADAQPGPPRLQTLLDVCQQVAVGQHRALGHSCRAAGVLQRRERVGVRAIS